CTLIRHCRRRSRKRRSPSASERSTSDAPRSGRVNTSLPPQTIGPWTVRTVETGRLWLDGGPVFGSGPQPIRSQAPPADERNRIQLAMRCLLLESQDRRVLIDDGVGDKFPPKLRDIYRVDATERPLERALGALGVRPEDITDVVLTHLHFDHA